MWILEIMWMLIFTHAAHLNIVVNQTHMALWWHHPAKQQKLNNGSGIWQKAQITDPPYLLPYLSTDRQDSPDVAGEGQMDQNLPFNIDIRYII